MSVMGKLKRKPKQSVWRDTFYLTAYELASQGLVDSRIARALGVTVQRYQRWLKEKPAFLDAIRRGRESRTGPPAGQWGGCGERFLDYAYKRLPPDLQSLWREIESVNGVDPEDGEYRRELEHPDAYRKIEAMFSYPGMVRARQSLFIHALVASNFNANEACRKLCVTFNTYRRWCEDPKFRALADQIEEIKDNFAEAGLFRGISQGEPSLIMFALRGRMPHKYNPKVSVRHEGEVNVLTASVDLDKLLDDMPLEERRNLLKRLKQVAPKEIPQGEVIDAKEVVS